jgi:hypothetical protein
VKNVTGSAAFPAYFEYGATNNSAWTKETKGSVSGSEWVKSYSDMLGRSWKTEYPNNAASTNFFNTKGQLVNGSVLGIGKYCRCRQHLACGPQAQSGISRCGLSRNEPGRPARTDIPG